MGDLYEARLAEVYLEVRGLFEEHVLHTFDGDDGHICPLDEICDGLFESAWAVVDAAFPPDAAAIFLADTPEAWEWDAATGSSPGEAAAAAFRVDVEERLWGPPGDKAVWPRDPWPAPL